MMEDPTEEQNQKQNIFLRKFIILKSFGMEFGTKGNGKKSLFESEKEKWDNLREKIRNLWNGWCQIGKFGMMGREITARDKRNCRVDVKLGN